MRYAQLEVDSGNIVQARSIFERALAIDYTYIPLWHRYAQVEGRARQFANAAAIHERGCSLLPFESKLWLQYLEFAEIRGDIDQCRSIFEKWVATGVKEAWKHWLRFEIRIGEQIGRLEKLSRRWVASDPSSIDAWLALAFNSPSDKFKQLFLEAQNSGCLTSEQLQQLQNQCYCGELDRTSPSNGGEVAARSSECGDIEMCWAALNSSPDNQKELLHAAMRDCSLPTAGYKTLECRKYALLCLRFAIAAEKGLLDISARDAYELALTKWDHVTFTSATLWRNYALHFIRGGDISLSRKVFGSALQKTRLNYKGNKHIIRDYIDLEKRLLETERVRKLFCILCSNWPRDPASWIDFARFELDLGEVERFQKLFSAALSYVEEKNDVDLLWKECAELVSDYDLVEGRKFWDNAVLKSRDRVELYAHYAMFEIGTGLEVDDGDPDPAALCRARNIFEAALASSMVDDTMDTLQVFDYFIQMEETYGTEDSVGTVRLRSLQFHSVDETSTSEITANESSESSDPAVEEARHSSESEDSSPNHEQVASASAIQKLMANAQKWKNSQN